MQAALAKVAIRNLGICGFDYQAKKG